MELNKKTFWRRSQFCGDLVTVCNGDNACSTVHIHEAEFPLSVEKVAALMNEAFQHGRDAKALEIRTMLKI